MGHSPRRVHRHRRQHNVPCVLCYKGVTERSWSTPARQCVVRASAMSRGATRLRPWPVPWPVVDADPVSPSSWARSRWTSSAPTVRRSRPAAGPAPASRPDARFTTWPRGLTSSRRSGLAPVLGCPGCRRRGRDTCRGAARREFAALSYLRRRRPWPRGALHRIGRSPWPGGGHPRRSPPGDSRQRQRARRFARLEHGAELMGRRALAQGGSSPIVFAVPRRPAG